MADTSKNSSVKVRFVIGESFGSQDACSPDVKQCCSKCVELGYESKWINEKDCLMLKPTNEEIFVIERFQGKTFEHLSLFKCVIMSPRALNEALNSRTVTLPEPGTQVFSVAMRDCIISIGNFPAEHKEHLRKLVGYMSGNFAGRSMTMMTHIVVNNRISASKYQKAEQHGVLVMNKDWIEEVWRTCQRSSTVLATEERFSHLMFMPPGYSAGRRVKSEPVEVPEVDKPEWVVVHGDELAPSCDEEEEEPKFECDVCKKHFASKNYLKVHIIETHATASAKHQCGLCGKSLSTAARLQYHLRAHSKSYSCNVCGKTFAYSNLLREHLLIHSGADRHKCPVCSRSYANPGDLRQHLKTHVISYNCDVCDQTFVYKNSLKKHLELHSGKKNFVCDVCKKSYTCISGLKKHKLIHDPTSKTTHKCYVCKESFQFKDQLKFHLKTHQKREFKCDVCPKTYMSASTLRKHKIAHASPHKCDQCEKTFAFKDSLVTHLKVHANGMSFKCDVCGKAYGAETHLRQHQKIHTDMYTCDYCDKVFSIKNSLREHISSHLAIRRHKCSVCGRDYVNGRKLRQHEKTHRESFKCFFCDKTCSRFPTLKVHFQTHSGLKNFKCALCKDRAYTTARGLKLHMASVHGEVKAEPGVAAKK